MPSQNMIIYFHLISPISTILYLEMFHNYQTLSISY